ncbi:GNAT family N-acetyltransferase [Bradyrhizobium sp. SZCCHNR2035]|uniref:GNAT family N-acetyltransferase n=1 Tax=Bradyrhizobium sp. SZCCHNR2035 TaxID=3057386 RepID=UPI0029163BAE|nr:GNAT family N-acetyltransferase [Bradyrhizobium sp. SZCCHNR2035]
MTDLELMRSVADAYVWHRALGNTRVQGPHCDFIKDPENPDVWSSNHISQITAATDPQINALMDEMDAQFGYCAHRLAVVDCFTPQRFVANLAMQDYRELAPTLQMILVGSLAPTNSPVLDIREPRQDQDWQSVYNLVALDHAEGARSNRTALPESVTRGIVAGLRKKSQSCRFFVAYLNGRPSAYGAAVSCPNGLGMVEDLFTLPSCRGRGIASALIHHCIETLRQDQDRIIFLGAHVTERPKRLYGKLGFTPLMLTREFLLKPSALGPTGA